MDCFCKRIRIYYYRFGVLILCFFLFVDKAAAQQKNDSVFDAGIIAKIALSDADAGKSFYLNEQRNRERFTLFVFLSPECLVCKNYSPVLNELFQQYSGQVNMYGITPGRTYSSDDIKKFRQEYDISFPLLIDQNKKLTQYLQATVTPQVILLNDDYQLLYKGAIDNRMHALGKQRIKPTTFFLDDALQECLSNKIISVKRTRAVGCIINDY